MMDMSSQTVGGALVFLAGTAALAVLFVMWTLGSRTVPKPRPHLIGRKASAYWHSPTGLQDERGISALPHRPARVPKD
ncbi:hypothetical protein [Sporichthya sp.]|uniref:hypothetical protein n=1 Tax=Sporichthya sp. TaxID=65475 RepID=UPI00180A5CAD|nr:hypothetical protein [Sporichthya sp.]MBA3744171.1 hypothetical protein [Sporichthya sp.]